MNNVANNKLKDCLELLARNTFDIYNSAVHQYPPSNDPHRTFSIIEKLEDDVKRLDGFKQCIEIVNADVNISSLFGKLVGTILEKYGTEDADTCILQFIYQLYFTNNTFDYPTFSEQYDAFEELFYSDRIRLVDTVRLHNFDAEADEIYLEEGLAIKKTPQVVDDRTKIQEMRYRPHVRFSRSEFVIERKYAKPKLVGDTTPEPNPEQVNREMRESGDLFDLVIKALRILKSSAVYRDHVISTETLTFIPHAGISSRSPLLENIVFGNKCVISTKEAEELEIVFNKTKQAKGQPFKIASNRLGFGLERRFDEDRLLDFMIGLESLYLPDGNVELTFRLSLRVAFITNQEMAERKQVFKFIKKMYGLRSKIAHGKKYEPTKEDISKIEEILRQSLKIYLDNPGTFTIDKNNNNGEVVKEGILDNIYFKG